MDGEALFVAWIGYSALVINQIQTRQNFHDRLHFQWVGAAADVFPFLLILNLSYICLMIIITIDTGEQKLHFTIPRTEIHARQQLSTNKTLLAHFRHTLAELFDKRVFPIIAMRHIHHIGERHRLDK